MKKIYQNFDGLEVSFQCCLPTYILNQLELAKNEAQKSRNSEFIRIGSSELLVSVAETGARGGYRYILDTGLDGATWFIAPSANPEHWNVRVSVKSLMIALHGYEETKQIILKTLVENFEVTFPQNTKNVFPFERISRFDICFDFISENFTPDPKCFVAHGRTKKDVIQRITYIGRNVETMMIGKMPNRQVIFYNKTKEIIAHGKSYWWDLWGIKKSELEGEIWRVEIRAGKKELNNWNLRKFTDLEKMAGDVTISILNASRYVIPSENDSNAARWEMANFWKDCINSAHEKLANFISNARREKIISDYRGELMEMYEKHIFGLLTSYTAIIGLDRDQIPGVLDVIASDVARRIEENPQKFRKKFLKAENKFELLK